MFKYSVLLGRLAVNSTPAAMNRSVSGLKSYLGNIKGEAEMSPVFPEVRGRHTYIF